MSNRPLIEAIAIASPDLHRELEQWSQRATTDGPVATDSVFYSTLKYAIRASTRPTPFGGFAGVGVVELHSVSSLVRVTPEGAEKFARADYKSLMQVVRELEQVHAQDARLQVFANPAVLRKGNRLHLTYRDDYGEGGTASSSVRHTNAVQIVLEMARGSVPLGELTAALAQCYPDRLEGELAAFVAHLVQERLLLTTLRPPLSHPDPLASLLDAARPLNSAPVDRLAMLHGQLERYSAAPMGAGEVPSGAREPDGLPEVRLQVDLHFPMRRATLSSAVAQDAVLAARLLLRYSMHAVRGPALGAYAEAYLERYGRREVPLLELLDEQLGLGAPPNYLQPPPLRRWRDFRHDESEMRKQHLARLVGDALTEGRREIHLDLEPHDLPAPGGALPSSLDVFGLLRATSPHALEQGDYTLVLSPLGSPTPAGRSMARFSHLSHQLHTHLRRLVAAEVDADNEALHAELAFGHAMGRANNVTMHAPLYDFEVTVAASPGVPFDRLIRLDDILIGVQEGKFYARLQSSGQRLRVHVPHMLVLTYAPNPVRFLADLCDDGVVAAHAWHWGHLEHLPFLPRVRHGRVVVSPARWKAPCEQWPVEGWHTHFADWRARYDVPRLVYVGLGDNRLLLDLECPAMLEIARRELAKTQGVLEEADQAGLGSGVMDEANEAYEAEIVVPLRAVTGTEQASQSLPTVPAFTPYPQGVRMLLPGRDCLYFRLYHDPAFADDLLADLGAWCGQRQDWIDRWFFIRYFDDRPHLRIRVFPTENSFAPLFEAMCAHLELQRDRGWLGTVELGTYERELERYGGMGVFEHCERLFGHDSQFVASALHALASDDLGLPRAAMAVRSMHALLRALGLTTDAMTQLFRGIEHPGGPRGAPDRERLNRLFAAQRKHVWTAFNDGHIEERAAGRTVLGALDLFVAQMRLLRPALEPQWHHNSASQLGVLTSLLHMHCNRWGINHVDEADTYYIAGKVLAGFGHHLPQGIKL